MRDFDELFRAMPQEDQEEVLREVAKYIPTPGSSSAVARGCTCPVFECMYWDEIESRRDRFSKNCRDRDGNLTGPWKDYPDEMAIKTVLRHMWKWLPISIEVQRQVEEQDGSVRMDLDSEALHPDTIDVEKVEAEPIPDDSPQDPTLPDPQPHPGPTPWTLFPDEPQL